MNDHERRMLAQPAEPRLSTRIKRQMLIRRQRGEVPGAQHGHFPGTRAYREVAVTGPEYLKRAPGPYGESYYDGRLMRLRTSGPRAVEEAVDV